MVTPLHHFPVELFQCLTTLSVTKFFLVFNLSNRKQIRWNNYYFKFVKWVSISGFSNVVVGGTHRQNRHSITHCTHLWWQIHPVFRSQAGRGMVSRDEDSRASLILRRWLVCVSQQKSLCSLEWSTGKAQQHLSPISVFWCFPPILQQLHFSAGLPLFCWQNRMLVGNTLFIVIECLVIMLWVFLFLGFFFFSFLKLNLFAIRNRC